MGRPGWLNRRETSAHQGRPPRDSDSFFCFKGNGAGGFTLQSSWLPIGWSDQESKRLERFNLNNDAYDDLVGVFEATSPLLVFLRNKGIAGTVPDVDFLQSVKAYQISSAGIMEYCHGDIDLDGKEEYIFAADATDKLALAEVDTAAESVADDSFKNIDQISIPKNTFQFCDVVDLDKDGNQDLVVGYSNQAHVFHNTSTGFVEVDQVTYPGYSSSGPPQPGVLDAKHDFDGDGYYDLFVGSGVYFGSGPLTIHGGGVFQTGVSIPDAATVFDDGCGPGPDYANDGGGMKAKIYTNNGNRSFGTIEIDPSGFYPDHWLYHADIDGDGSDDLVMAKIEQTIHTIGVYINQN